MIIVLAPRRETEIGFLDPSFGFQAMAGILGSEPEVYSGVCVCLCSSACEITSTVFKMFCHVFSHTWMGGHLIFRLLARPPPHPILSGLCAHHSCVSR